jgi:hypothetical protein
LPPADRKGRMFRGLKQLRERVSRPQHKSLRDCHTSTKPMLKNLLVTEFGMSDWVTFLLRFPPDLAGSVSHQPVAQAQEWSLE